MVRNVCLALACLSLSATAASAQEGVLSELYGAGVHAYYAGRPVKAHTLLTEAIDAGSTDPRAYYFRGLAYLQLGRADDARDDFTKAAELEVLDANEFFDVSRSLERIQGRQRLAIERYRQLARLDAYKRARRLEYERYERIRRAEPSVTIPPDDVDLVPSPVEEVDEPFDDPDMDAPEMEEPDMDEPEAPEEEMIQPEAPLDEDPFPADDDPAMDEPLPEPEDEPLPDVDLPPPDVEDPFGA